MLSKEEILKKFQREPEKYWKVELFEQRGFVRKVCPSCGKGYWTLDAERTHCPDPSCGEEYDFIGRSITKKKLDYIEAWRSFEKFFVAHGHTSISRYPVLARWRADLFFNIASIVDFQRFDDGIMSFDYPANPLVVPQMCLRFSDIPNVGLTGRHHTCFMMPGQHAFGWPKEGYWKDKCIELNFEFLTGVLGIPKEKLVYVEDLWTMPDLSALGPYVETFSLGLELANNGFMQFGVVNGRLVELPMKVIDVGWGLERLVWFSNGTPTGYDVVFGPVTKKLMDEVNFVYDEMFLSHYSKVCGKLDVTEIRDPASAKLRIAKILGVSLEELEKNLEPLQALYSVLDHTRALVFAIADGGLPSNAGGGYNLRVILRRALAFIQKFGWKVRLEDVALWHLAYLKRLFPELEEYKAEVVKILEVETEKYKTSRERSERLIRVLKREVLDEAKLVELYESKGITPEQLGMKAPAGFYVKITQPHMGKARAVGKPITELAGIPPTQLLFYEEPDRFEFDAKVLKIINEKFVVLDKTAFYARGGGQEPDVGTIAGCEVVDVQKYGDVVVHELKECEVEEGQVVRCRIDEKRREILSKHHTATHLLNYCTRKVLGSWVWQYGAKKDVDKARLDLTHYRALSEEELRKIERLANSLIEKNLPVKIEVLPRREAEEKYGFRIYQGGVPGKEVRVVSIDELEHEACGGTHCKSTGEVRCITLLRSRHIQDGVVRIEFAAGNAAFSYLKERAAILKEVIKKLGVKEEDVVEATKALFERWKKLRKELRKKDEI